MSATVIVPKDTKRADYYRSLCTHLRRTGRKKSHAHKTKIDELNKIIATQQAQIAQLKNAILQVSLAAVRFDDELRKINGRS